MKVAVNTSARYANRAVTLLVGFFLTPFLLARLGPDSLALQVLGIQALQFCMLFGNAFSRGYSRFATLHFARGDFDSMNRVLGSGLTLTAALAGLALLFIAILEVLAGKALGIEEHLVSSARWVVLIIGAGYIFDQLVGVFEAPLFVTQKFYVLEIGQVVSRVLAVLGVVLLFQVTTPTIVGWVALTVAFSVVLKLLYTIPVALKAVPQLRLRFHMPSGPEFKEMAGFSLAALLGTLGFLFYYASSSIVISHMPELGTSKVLAYNLGQRWDPHVREIVLAFAASLTPVFTSLHAIGDRTGLRSSFLSSCRQALLMAMLPCLLLFSFARPFMTLWVGSNYAGESSQILQLAILNVLISVPSIVANEALVGLGRIRRVAWAVVAGGILNIILGVVLSGTFGLGILGLAISMIVSYSGAACTFILWSAMRELDVSCREFLSKVVIAPVCVWFPSVALAFGLQMYNAPRSWVVLGVESVLSAGIFLAGVYAIVLSTGERLYLLTTTRAVFTRLKRHTFGAPPEPVIPD
jgi:O-antigen/teichoic acid export membrane protein